jgi:hypothetical protein
LLAAVAALELQSVLVVPVLVVLAVVAMPLLQLVAAAVGFVPPLGIPVLVLLVL